MNFRFDNNNSFTFHNDAFFYQKRAINIGDKKVWAHVFHSETKKTLELVKFLEKISEIEDVAKNKTGEEISEILKLQELENYFNNAVIPLKRDVAAIDKKIQSLGKFILITNREDFSSKIVLENYRNKDLAEKLFDSFKTEIGTNRLRTKKDSTANGALFISFIALIIYSHIIKTLVKQKKLTVPKVLAALTTLKAVSLSNGTTMLSELTKKNKDIFNSLS